MRPELRRITAPQDPGSCVARSCFPTPRLVWRRLSETAEFLGRETPRATRSLTSGRKPIANCRPNFAADRPEDVTTATGLLEIPPGDEFIATVDYLSRAYWERCLCWPDLLFYRRSEFFFAAVKLAGDSLTADQKSWMAGNSSNLHLPFRLVNLHRAVVE